MKKCLLSLMLLAVVACAFVGCNSNSKVANEDSTNPVMVENENLLLTQLSSSLMVSTSNVNKVAVPKMESRRGDCTGTNKGNGQGNGHNGDCLNPGNNCNMGEVSEEVQAKLDEMMNQLDVYMSYGTSFKVESQESTREDYANQMLVSFVDFSGETVEYTLYYNDLVDALEDCVNPEKAPSNRVFYEGIAVYQEVEYSFTMKSCEDETETNNFKGINFKMLQGENSFVEIKTVYETDETGTVVQKFSYTEVTDGEVLNQYSFKMGTTTDENGNTVSVVKVELDGITYRFDQAYDEEGQLVVNGSVCNSSNGHKGNHFKSWNSGRKGNCK